MVALSQILQDQTYKYYANTFSNENQFFLSVRLGIWNFDQRLNRPPVTLKKGVTVEIL